jgi:hypothetical protein
MHSGHRGAGAEGTYLSFVAFKFIGRNRRIGRQFRSFGSRGLSFPLGRGVLALRRGSALSRGCFLPEGFRSAMTHVIARAQIKSSAGARKTVIPRIRQQFRRFGPATVAAAILSA